MKAEIISIGSELVLGQTIDTNSAYLAAILLQNGIEVCQATAVGDHLLRMEETIKASITRSPIVITGGGLGPTEDDLTREAIANVSRRPLVFRSDLMEQIEALFKKRGYRMAENNRRQAYIPEGAIPIENPKGTAPGFIVEDPKWCIICLPGVPSEMRYLMENTVIPYLRERFHLERQVVQYRVLRACGLGESAIGLQIRDLMKQGQNPSVGTLASIGDIKIRITAKADSPEEASTLIRGMEQEIRKRLGILVYGVDDETLPGNIARGLERASLTLSTVETFTGGSVTQKMASTGSPSFVQGLVLSTEGSQRRFVNLSAGEFEGLARVPQRLSEALSKKCRTEFGTDLGLAVFGRPIEEQGKGEHLFETSCSLSTPEGMEEQSHSLGGEPEMVRERTSIIALDLLRKFLAKGGSSKT